MLNLLMKILLLCILLSLTYYVLELSNKKQYANIKSELELFYKADLDNCRIIDIKQFKFPGMGNYAKLKTDCNRDYYPILFENMTVGRESYFKTNSKINKSENSREFYLTVDNEDHKFLIIDISYYYDSAIIYYILLFGFSCSVWLVYDFVVHRS